MSNILRDLVKLSPIPIEFEEAKVLLAKTVGYSIIVGSSLIKLPQLLKIVNAKSSTGVSFWGQFLELLACTATFTYGYANKFPFSSYGESLFLLIETFLICLIVLLFANKKSGLFVFAVAYLSSLVAANTGKVPIKYLWYLQSMNVPMAVGGKMIQAFANWKNGHTGQCSAITSVCLFLGCIARIFTSIQETNDQLMIASFSAGAVANLVLVSQIFYYWESTNRMLAREAKKKKK